MHLLYKPWILWLVLQDKYLAVDHEYFVLWKLPKLANYEPSQWLTKAVYSSSIERTANTLYNKWYAWEHKWSHFVIAWWDTVLRLQTYEGYS